jgi:hypothetical protein
MTPKRNRPRKKATRNKKGYEKILKAITDTRQGYEQMFPSSVDYDAVETPEGMPSFVDFRNQREADKAYDKVDPLYKATKTVPLPLGLAYQRWRGSKTSASGQNYRKPYWAKTDLDDPVRAEYILKFLGADVDARSSKNSPYYGRKHAHAQEKLKNTRLDKAKQTLGAVFPPANILLGGGATTGGTAMDEAAILGLQAFLASKIVPMEKRQTEIEDEIFDRNSTLTDDELSALQAEFRELDRKKMPYGIAHFYNRGLVYPQTIAGTSRNLTQEGLVVPTGGFMLDPYKKGVRLVKKGAKKKIKKEKERLLRGEKGYENQQRLDVKRFERIADEYEKTFGFRPSLPELRGYVRPEHKAGQGRRGQNRNPIFLKDGGIVPFMKPKKK